MGMVMDLEPAQEKIVGAYVRIAKDVPADQITVTRLCSEAGISRSTFYVQFDGLESVSSVIEYGTLRDIRRIFRDCEYISLTKAARTGKPIPMLVHEFEYIDKHRDIFGWLLSPNGSEPFKRGHFKLFSDAMDRVTEGTLEEDERSLLVTLCYGAFERLVLEWLSGGYEASPEAMAGIATRTFIALVNEFKTV